MNDAATELADLLESHWDLADATRRAKSQANRRRTDLASIPDISRGDYVLYAVHVPDTKLDYTWRGPAQVLYRVNPQVFIVEPIAVEHIRPFPVHIQRLRRFASSDLGITEQLKIDVMRDHPDNVVQKLTKHRFDEGELWFLVRWLGFTAARDTWQRATELAQSCPDMIMQYYRKPRTKRTPELVAFVKKEFPAADHEARLFEKVGRQRDFPKSRRKRQKQTASASLHATADVSTAAPAATQRRRRGRPRKANASGGAVHGTATQTPRRKRGRPRKAAAATITEPTFPPATPLQHDALHAAHAPAPQSVSYTHLTLPTTPYV